MSSSNLEPGYCFERELLLTEVEIIAGARFLGDRNPLHNDPLAAAQSRFKGLIACGPHVSGIHACMLPTRCTELGYDVLGTVFTVRYTAPVLAQVRYQLAWTITTVTEHRNGGHFIDWTGTITNPNTNYNSVEATGQILATPSAGRRVQ